MLVQLTTFVSTVLPLSAVLLFSFGFLSPLDCTAPSHNLAFLHTVEPKLPSYSVSKPKLISNAVEPLEGVKSMFPEELANKHFHSYFPRKENCCFICVNVF